MQLACPVIKITPLPFGKHRGKTLKEVGKTNYDYIQWLAGYQTAEHSGEDKRIEYRLAKKVKELIETKSREYETNKVFVDTVTAETIDEILKKLMDNVDLIPNSWSWGKAWFVTYCRYQDWVKEARRMMDKKRKCTHCNKTLVPIGKSRVGSKKKSDWMDRKMHKKCWKKVNHSSLHNFYED